MAIDSADPSQQSTENISSEGGELVDTSVDMGATPNKITTVPSGMEIESQMSHSLLTTTPASSIPSSLSTTSPLPFHPFTLLLLYPNPSLLVCHPLSMLQAILILTALPMNHNLIQLPKNTNLNPHCHHRPPPPFFLATPQKFYLSLLLLVLPLHHSHPFKTILLLLLTFQLLLLLLLKSVLKQKILRKLLTMLSLPTESLSINPYEYKTTFLECPWFE